MTIRAHGQQAAGMGAGEASNQANDPDVLPCGDLELVSDIVLD
eukprot:CAMPEP_0174384170 /NCGR_PEP_ID=MMETSP0811_2-20130205/125744_1 /TAXON_ID=73025 ORGANISM="Eutreptiella gymnastica-like, Strain CCMP1594" /NCGR_SAMPLE_ID=MMETSP0811_2 /ASSEMBLY_ACC=CAM_ASM_000667 /LENGTH=42 /DNA_ID= /DNA_START= /DNA_END= /DNA_ORIENTATION=